MIKLFELGDEKKLRANEFSDVEMCAYAFEDRDFEKFTLEHEGQVEAIICFRAYWEDNYIAFFLISDDMPVICARELKEFVDCAIIQMGAKRVQTDSVACDVLDRWHRFLGFELEGRRRKMMYDVDFHMWARVI